MSDERATLARRLADAGLSTQRFIDVHNGAKGTHNHEQYEPRDPTLSGNYGVYAGNGLVDVDIDVYSARDDAAGAQNDTPGVAAIHDLPDTFTVASPHTDGNRGGHRYYAVETDRDLEDFDVDAILERSSASKKTKKAARDDPVALTIADRLGKVNPHPSWGEVRVVNQYVVGPGSQISPGGCVYDRCEGCVGCDKDWCEECSKPDGGRYEIANDAPIATIHVDDLIKALLTDPNIDTVNAETGGNTPSLNLNDEDVLAKARNAKNGEKFRRLYDYGDISANDGVDRSHSGADMALCSLLAFWTGGDRQQMDRLFRNSELYRPKWDRVGEQTIENAIAHTADYYEPTCDNKDDPNPPDIDISFDDRPNAEAVQVVHDTMHNQSGISDETAISADSGGIIGINGNGSTDISRSEPGLDGAQQVSWEDVRFLFERTESGSTTQAYNLASRLVLDDESFVCVRDTDALYYYDPEAGHYRRGGKAHLREVLQREMPGHLNDSRLRNIRLHVETASYVDTEDFEPPRGKVCVENGVVDLETGDLLDHSPEWYFKAGLPVAYDPDAECPEWYDFLTDCVDNPAKRKTLAEFVGYALEGWHHIHEKNIFVVGPRRSGKTTFADTVTKLFGPKATATLSPHKLADTTFDSADLYETMLNVRNDINASKIEDSGTLKTIFSGERIRGERKFEAAFEFEPTAKHLFTANWLPRIVGQDESLYRRVIIVEFPDKVPEDEVDRTLKQTLSDELPGILNWAIEGRNRLATNGAFTYEPSPATVREQWLSWRTASLRYLYSSGEVEVTGDEVDHIERKIAYHAFKEWSGRNGYGIVPQQGFTNQWKLAPHVESVGDDFAGVRFTGLASEDEDNGRDNTRETDRSLIDFGTDHDGDDDNTDFDDRSQDNLRQFLVKMTDAFDNSSRGAIKEQVLDSTESEGFDRNRADHVLTTMLEEGVLVEGGSSAHIRLA